MLISFREAADLSFQVALAVSVVVCGTALATVTAKSKQKPRQVIDVSRPALWETGLMRIDRQGSWPTITLHTPAASDRQGGNAPCLDGIGLRIACDLLTVNRRPS